MRSLAGKAKMTHLTYVTSVKVNVAVGREVYSSFKRLKLEIINKMIIQYNETLSESVENKVSNVW